MQERISALPMLAALVVGLAMVLPGVAGAQGKRPEHIRGTITAANANAITVKTREGGTAVIALPAKARVSGYAKVAIDRIKKGSYIGVTAVPLPDGMLRAQALHIFPPNMRGRGEGHRKWDLTPASTMTNADVDLVVDGVKGRVISLKYKGGASKVIVPPGTPVVAIVRAGRDMLKPGTHVFAVARKGKDGKYQAVRIGLGVDGVVPPM